MSHVKQPDGVHHALSLDLHGILGRYAGVPDIEKIAILSQVIGHLVTDLPSGSYGTGEVMGCVALNIASGNEQSARSLASAIHGASQ